MALKVVLLLVAALLLVNASAMDTSDAVSEQLHKKDKKHHHDHHDHHDHHHHHPHTTGKMSEAPPPPAYSKPPVSSPVSPPTHGCEAMCFEFCKTRHPKRICMKDCNPCCQKARCVPSAKYNCNPWDRVIHHGREIICPKP